MVFFNVSISHIIRNVVANNAEEVIDGKNLLLTCWYRDCDMSFVGSFADYFDFRLASSKGFRQSTDDINRRLDLIQEGFFQEDIAFGAIS